MEVYYDGSSGSGRRSHELDCSGSGWGQVAGACECGNEPSDSTICGEILTSWEPVSFWVTEYVCSCPASSRTAVCLTIFIHNDFFVVKLVYVLTINFTWCSCFVGFPWRQRPLPFTAGAPPLNSQRGSEGGERCPAVGPTQSALRHCPFDLGCRKKKIKWVNSQKDSVAVCNKPSFKLTGRGTGATDYVQILSWRFLGLRMCATTYRRRG